MRLVSSTPTEDIGFGDACGGRSPSPSPDAESPGIFSLSGEVDRPCPIWRPVSRVWGRMISPGEHNRYHPAMHRLAFARSLRHHQHHGPSSRPHADSCPSVRPEAFWLLGTRLLAGSFPSASHTVPSPLPLVAVSIARVRVFHGISCLVVIALAVGSSLPPVLFPYSSLLQLRRINLLAGKILDVCGAAFTRGQ